MKFALQHPEIFSSDLVAVDIGQQRPLIPLQIDPPDHVKYRRVLDPHLAPRQILPREERMKAVVNELIDRFIERGSCDFHAELSVPLPCTVFLELCGLPLSELDTFLGWKDDIIRPQIRHPEIAFDLDALVALRHKTGQAIYDYFTDVIADRRADPGDDVISQFAEGVVDGERMSHDQMLDIGFLFILGGLDTVTSTLDCAVGHLGRDAALRDALVSDPTAIPAAIEEILRLHTPVMQVLRVVKEPYEMHGVKMEPGDHVMLMLGAADTDPAEFGDHADQADFDREHNRHLAFGGGAASVPRLPSGARSSSGSRSRRCTSGSPTTASPMGPELKYSPGIREIEHLPLDFTPASSSSGRSSEIVLDADGLHGPRALLHVGA